MQIRSDVINGGRQGVMNLGSDWARLLIGKAVWDVSGRSPRTPGIGSPSFVGRD